MLCHTHDNDDNNNGNQGVDAKKPGGFCTHKREERSLCGGGKSSKMLRRWRAVIMTYVHTHNGECVSVCVMMWEGGRPSKGESRAREGKKEH